MLEGAKSIGAGAATIASAGAAVGIGNVFSSSIHSVARNPSLAKQLFFLSILLFTFYIAICNDGDGVLGISRILKLRNQLLSHWENKIRSKDPKTLEGLSKKSFHTGLSYMYSSLFEVPQFLFRRMSLRIFFMFKNPFFKIFLYWLLCHLVRIGVHVHVSELDGVVAYCMDGVGGGPHEGVELPVSSGRSGSSSAWTSVESETRDSSTTWTESSSFQSSSEASMNQVPHRHDAGPSNAGHASSSFEPSALNQREEELLKENLAEKKGALGDGQEISEVRKDVESYFQIESKVDEFEFVKRLEKEKEVLTNSEDVLTKMEDVVTQKAKCPVTCAAFNEIEEYEGQIQDGKGGVKANACSSKK